MGESVAKKTAKRDIFLKTSAAKHQCIRPALSGFTDFQGIPNGMLTIGIHCYYNIITFKMLIYIIQSDFQCISLAVVLGVGDNLGISCGGIKYLLIIGAAPIVHYDCFKV
ncbi:hypothetical protein SDC9_143650 [bioreactor metagenome]|uniref:Uncharacterized protein n=1 Tax=bioreactor metagenome TaxID=1076179 RepID=A0A645E440_9ZZZZ